MATTGWRRVWFFMCGPDGTPIELNGKRFRRRFGNKSGELNDREVNPI
jgi:hypothetical protein